MAVFNLVKHADVTHTAINNGSWFDPATWAGNSVPGDDARVLISDGVVVDYDGISNDRLMTVRVDGELHFSTTTDSKIVVDTLVVDQNGTLTAGTKSNPVAGNVNVDIVIATHLCQQAALALAPQVTVAPGCPVGYSPYHMARKGTLTLRKETLQAYLYDTICRHQIRY